MGTVEVTTLQALLGFPDLRAAVVAGWHRGEPVSELLVSSEVATVHDAITAVLPPGWILVDNAIHAPAGDPQIGRVSVEDLRVRLGHLPELLARVNAPATKWLPWQPR